VLRRSLLLGLALACTGPVQETDTDEVIDTSSTDATDDTDVPWQDPPIEGIPDAPVLWSHAHGVYDAPFTLTLSAPSDGAVVRYTLDGRDPVESGEVYEAPLEIDGTTVIRAVVVDDVLGSATVETRTFVFPADVAGQVAPQDWPTEWWDGIRGGPYGADYEIDPDIVGPDPGAFEQALRDAPIVSITLPPEELFDEETGIHANPQEGGFEWERVTSLEMFGDDGQVDVTTTCGLRIHGGAGRRPDRSPKKSFRLAFRGDYGDGMLDVPLFLAEDDHALVQVDRFDTLVLRAGYNRSWGHFEHIQRRRAQYLHEALGGRLHRQMGRPAPRVRLVHLFVDGLYWGVYQAEERPDAAFMAQHFGGEEDEYDSLNVGEPSKGDAIAWQELLAVVRQDLSDDANYAAVEARLDVDAFIDYHLLQLTLGNIDWPRKNWWAGRHRDGGRFHFFMWDAELTMSNTTDSRIEAAEPDGPGEIFQALRAQPEFIVRFGDAVQAHLVEPDGALYPDNWAATWFDLDPAVRSLMVAESARWGDHWRDVRGDPEADLYTVDAYWDAENARVPDFYIPRRTPIVVEQLRAAGLYPSVEPPILTPSAGEVAVGTSVLGTGSGEVWATLDGGDPRAPGGAVAEGAFRIDVEPVSIDADATLTVRTRSGEAWSARRVLAYQVSDSGG